MKGTENVIKLTEQEQQTAMESYSALADILKQVRSENPQIEVKQAKAQFKVPLNALRLLSDILEAMGKGQQVSVVRVATEVTTQKAADILGCSRPFLVKLLEEGKIPFTKIGRHRRIKMEDILGYKQKQKTLQKKRLIQLM